MQMRVLTRYIAVAVEPSARDQAHVRGEFASSATRFVGKLLVALHESRRRQAERELVRHAHLIQYARAHPLTVVARTAPAITEPGNG